MTILERQPNRLFGLVKGDIASLAADDTRYVLTDYSDWGGKIRRLKIMDDDSAALYDIVGTRLIPLNDAGGVRLKYDWEWRMIKRESINFRTTEGTVIFWEKL